MKTDLRRSFPVASMSLAALLAQSGTAQQANDDAQPMLEEVVVTAQKRSQSIQEVPVAMTAFGGEALEDNGAVNLEDLSGIAPNVQLTQMAIIPNVGSFTIRGINFTDPDPNADPKTGVSLDGVPLTRNNGLLMDMFDIESVEVLRGPQGTLYGRNNMAGTIKLVSARPTEETGGKVKATIGDYGQQILRAVLNSGSFADGRLRAKVAVSHRDFDGQHENLFTGTELGAQQARGGRATVSYEGDRFDVTVIADMVDEEFTGPATSNVLNDPDGIGRDGDEYEVHQDVDGYSDFDTWGLTLQANRELDAGTLTLVAGHREIEYETFGDFDGHAGAPDRPRMLPPPFSFFQAFHVRRIAEHDQQTVELRFADSHSDRFDYVVGLFHVQEEFTQHNFQNVGFPPLPIFFPLDDPDSTPPLLTVGQESESTSFFGQTDINLSERFALVLGGRINMDRKEVGITRPNGFREGDDVDWDEFTWKAGMNYFVNEDVMLYAHAATGYKGGGYNSRATLPQNVGPYEPETLIAYEVGMKGDFAEGRVRLNAAAFTGNYDDVQAAERRPGAAGQFDVLTDNLGDVEISGIELESTFLVTPALTFRANLAYLDAGWEEYLTAGRDFSFLDLKGAAEWSGYLGADYRVPLGNNEIAFHIDLRYSDEYNVNGTTSAGNPVTRVQYDHFYTNSVASVNAHVAFLGQDGRYRVSLYGRNLGDDTYPVSGVHLAGPVVFYGMPRQIGIEFEVNW